MARRDELFSAGRKAFEILDFVGAKRRVEEEGYTRIDPFVVAAKEGVPVLVRPLDRLLGAFIREDRPGILVNSQRPIGLVHMTCAHELGHYFMGHLSTTDQSIEYDSAANLQERQAEWFAYQLLMPRWLVSHLFRLKSLDVESLQDAKIVYQLSLRMGLSYTGTVWSLHRQNLLTLSQANTLVRVQPQTIKRELAQGNIEDPVRQDVWLLDSSDRNLILEPRPNDRFVVDLPSHASAGYLWSLGEAAQAGFSLHPILIDGRNETLTDENNSVPVGASRSIQYMFDRNKNQLPDPLRIEFFESQPWRPRHDGDYRFGLSAQFETVSLGLTAGSKAMLLSGVDEL